MSEMDRATVPGHVELVREILLCHRGKKRIAGKVSQAKTYGELTDLLRAAFNSS